jgi:hypothetical protein
MQTQSISYDKILLANSDKIKNFNLEDKFEI